MDKATPWIVGLIILAMIAGISALVTAWQQDHRRVIEVPPDDGLHRYVDNETGCQYIGNRFGFTIRLDKDGKPICHGR
jgi:hypothetical protein